MAPTPKAVQPMRRTLTLLLAGVLLLPTHEAQATWRHDRCRYQGLEHRSWTDTEVRKTIRCAVDHWRVPGGRHKALDVARCESGFEADALSLSGSAGAFQFIQSTWDSTWHRFRPFAHRWDLQRNIFNGRSNVLMAIRKAHVDGWGAW